jgi:uncharacterized protein (TIGR00369 family)
MTTSSEPLQAVPAPPDPAEAWSLPLHDFLGVRLETTGAGGGLSRVVMPITEQLRGPMAPLHGGVISTLIDIACGAAIEGADPSKIPVSTDLTIRYFRQPKVSPVVAKGTVVHHGSRLISVECEVTDGEGRRVARGTGTYMLLGSFGGAES